MKTKADLQAWLEVNGACRDAREWVAGQDGDADAILDACIDVDWLCWALSHLSSPSVVEFARECASRGGDAARYANAARAAAAYAAAAAHYADAAAAACFTAWHAARAAAAAWCATPYSADERERQLADLRGRIRAALGET